MDTRWTLAIDFGTTFTSAAVGADGRVDLIEVDGVVRLPSAVLWQDDGFVVGVAADAQRGAQPDRLERTPKRHLGVREHMILGGTPVSVVDGVAAVLRTVYEEALRRRDGNPPTLVCLTHPARWGEARIGALAEAASKAGITNPTFLAEPIAAALRYADVNIGPGDHVAVYDLGGGTFDTAVLRRTDDGFMLVGPPGGDERLGGEDFDHRLADHLRAQIAVTDPEAALSLATSPERIWRVAATELLTQARLAKESLSSHASYTVYLPAPIDRELRVTRPEFEALVRNDLLRTVDELGLAVQRSGLQRDELAAIYLTGGSSRIPLVTNLVHEAFAQVPNTWEDPKCVVALGAIRADALRGAAVPAQPGFAGADTPTTVLTATPPRSRWGSRRKLAVGIAAVLAVGGLTTAVAMAIGDDSGSSAEGATTTADVATTTEPDATTTSTLPATTTTAAAPTSTTIVVASTTTAPAGDALITVAPPVGGASPGGSSSGGSSGGSTSGGAAPATPTTAAPAPTVAPTVATTVAPPPPADPVVPTVTGQLLNTAANNLHAAGFHDLPFVRDCYGSNSAGSVVSQEPGGGSRVPASTPIRLFVQADNCSFVPSVIGQDLNSAVANLNAAGFNNIPWVYNCYGSPNINAVVSQSPSGGQVATTTAISLQLQANDC